jgi:hypothetical protein
VDDLHALSHLAGQLNNKMAASSTFEEVAMHPTGDNVDLDNLFAFLSEIHADGGSRNMVLEEIEHQMNELATDFDQEIELAARDQRYPTTTFSTLFD